MEFALTTPIILLFLMIGVQYALVAHAQNGMKAAAEEGAAVARSHDGTAGQAEATAQRYLSELSTQMFTSTSISASRGTESATVTVTGSVKRLVPFVPVEVSRTSAGPVERFVEEEAP